MRSIAALLTIAAASGAHASSYTRRASLAVLDVPLAETVGRANASFGLEFFVERDRRGWGTLPLPLSIVIGVGDDFDVGFSAQFGGQPGDAAISPEPVLQWTAAAKYSIFRAVGWRPLLSVEAVLDRPTANLRMALRAVGSSRPIGPLRLTGFAGAEIGLTMASLAPTAGVALVARHGSSGVEGALEVLHASNGWLAGAGVRWGFSDHVGVSLTATWIPQEASVRISLGLAVFLGQPSLGPLASPIVPAVDETPEQTASGPRKYLDDRPRLRLKIRQPRLAEDPAGRHHQYGPTDGGDRAGHQEAQPVPAGLRPQILELPASTPEIPPPTPEIPPPTREIPPPTREIPPPTPELPQPLGEAQRP